MRPLLLLLALLLGACAAGPPARAPAPVYFPPPPDPPRYVYETSLRTAASVKRVSREERLRRMLTGQDPRRVPVLAKPFDVAAYGGHVVVTDTVRRAAVMFNVRRGKVYPFGVRGEGVLAKPLGVAMDHQGTVYIADVSAREVKVYDHLGLFLRRIGGPELFRRPVDVAVTPDGAAVYVLDSGGIDSTQHQVLRFDARGRLLGRLGKRGRAPGEFNLPTQLALDPQGRLYVLDAGNFRVQVFDSEGRFLRSWGGVGRGFGQFARPRGLAVGPDGLVYVSDAAFRNVQIFDPEGRLLMWIGGEGLEDKPGQYTLPAGLAVDETNRLYVVDQLFRKVEVIRRLPDPDGRGGKN